MTYSLISTITENNQCQEHKKENIADVYNSAKWKLTPVDVDKLKFICSKCKSERVYKINKQKVLLDVNN
jgi:hypothetical protein